MCGVRMTYYEKLVLVKNLHAKHYTKIIYHVYFVFKLYYNQHSINVKNFLSALLMVSKGKISVYFLVRVYYEYQNMYVFIPEQFNVQKLHKGDFNIFAETYFTKGIKFFSNQGRWVFFENCFGHSNSQQIHWLHILYLYSEVSHEDLPITESSNALVFKENTHLILEIIHQVQYGSVIKALFHNISLKDILSVTENNNTDFTTDIIKPLDLSITFVTKNLNLLSRKNNGRSKNMLPCDICGKEFDRPSLLKRHIRTHTGERPHVCEVCGKGFSTSSSLNTHKRIHSGERPHQCRICGKRFTASSNLYYHRLTHSAEKPHKCDICGKSFPTPGNLRSHKYSHEGLSPYKCNLCNRMFSKHVNLKNHVNLHKIK